MIDAMVEILGWALIDAAWLGVIVGALYAGARLVVRDARLRLAIGHVALLALAVAPVICMWLRIDRPAALAAVDGMVAAPVQAVAASAASPWNIEQWLPWLVAAWAAGVAVHTLRLFAQWRGLRRLCAASTPVDADWMALLADLRARMGVRAKVRLLHGAQVVTPMLVGVLRPTILLPTSLLLQLPRAQVELIVAHELAHLHRLDTWFNLLQTCLDTLLFFHPAVRWVSRKVREDRELCCDELVVRNGGNRMLYARTLLAMAEAHHHGPAPAPALGAAGGLLMQRVQRIVDVPVARQGTQMPAMGTLLALAALLWLLRPDGEHPLLRDLGLPPLAASSLAIALPSVSGGVQLGVSDLALALQPFMAQRIVLDRPATADIENTDVGDAALPSPAASIDLAPATIVPVPASRDAFDALPLAAAPSVPGAASEGVAALPQADAGLALPPVADVAVEPLQAHATHQVAPDYPRSARLGAVEGFVLLRYRVDADGRARDVRVEDAVPAGVFERAARRALEQWRFEPETGASVTYLQQFDFRLEGNDARRAGEDCHVRIGSRICRPVP